MSVALLAAIIELGLLLVYPYISYAFVDSQLSYSVPEYLILCFSSDLDALSERFCSILGCDQSTAEALIYLPLFAILGTFLFTLISFFLALAKKNKGAGVLQVIGGSIGIILTLVLSFSLCAGENSSCLPAKIIVTPEFMILTVLMTAFGILSAKNPDAALGSKAAYAAPAMGAPVQRSMYTPAPAPARQPVYTPAAPAPAPAPSPIAAAPTMAMNAPAAPAAPAASSTYTCPVCGTSQKSDMAFCTFCGNPNPNK